MERLDVEIKSLTERLCLLKTERNSLSVTYTLPAEILAEIFVVVQEEIKRGYSSGRRAAFAKYGWLSMTRTSRHWRQVALECPRLWCDIRVGTLPPPMIQIFLARSGGRNLSVEVNGLARSGGRDLSAEVFGPPRRGGRHWVEYGEVFAEALRFEKLEFSLERKTFSRLLSQLISTPLPQLRSLSISGDVTIPDDIFQGTTPQLHSLSLRQCQFSLDSPLLSPNLTTLDLSYCHMGSTTLGDLYSYPEKLWRRSFTPAI
ncbi:hypothetical protein BDN72DRAFT_905953 [Pluteus cervinus]|uniref:Uncharacterized protein n=1 Tax=Pluteus cervinus TaxID=181527 RepID=A0ACD3A3A3_9AGAR|nr:hypothetical protein BDN72DRAFT_905953 [Pluteus cervinus]